MDADDTLLPEQKCRSDQAEQCTMVRIWLTVAFSLGIAISIGDLVAPSRTPFIHNLAGVDGTSHTFVVTSLDHIRVTGGDLAVGDHVTEIDPRWISRVGSD